MAEASPYLRAALLEVVENQLRGNDPPETKKTYERLLALGKSESEAKQLLSYAIFVEMIDMLKEHREFDRARFAAELDRLPTVG